MNRISFILIGMMLILAAAFTGCEKRTGHRPGEEKGAEETGLLDSSAVVRIPGTNVASIDENGDGKLYQCPMDFEIISDTEGRCPKCKMNLEEYTVERAAENFSK